MAQLLKNTLHIKAGELLEREVKYRKDLTEIEGMINLDKKENNGKSILLP
jgi:hypothetical protein